MSYKTAAFSDDLSSVFAQAAELAAGAGLDGLAVRNVGGRNIATIGDREVAEVKRVADAHGLEISALGSQLGRNSFLEETNSAKEASELLRPVIDHAAVLGASNVRIFGPWLHCHDPLERWADRPVLADRLEAVAEWLAPSLSIAEEAGVTLMVELEGASYIGQVAEARELLRHVQSTALALCWDVCNGWWAGELPLEEGWPLVRELNIVDVQTKDTRSQTGNPDAPAFEQIALGEGDIPYPAIIGRLFEIGYSGWFTAERVYHPRKPEEDPVLQQNTLGDIRALQAMLSRAESARPAN
ncbi:Xylose isomerase-like TIM barrel [compost metagenome]